MTLAQILPVSFNLSPFTQIDPSYLANKVCSRPTGKYWVHTHRVRGIWNQDEIDQDTEKSESCHKSAILPMRPLGKGVHRKQSKAKPHFIIS